MRAFGPGQPFSRLLTCALLFTGQAATAVVARTMCFICRRRGMGGWEPDKPVAVRDEREFFISCFAAKLLNMLRGKNAG